MFSFYPQSFRVETAAAFDGKTALEKGSIFEPDYLVTDVMMPVMNGIELAIQLREMLPACKVILFSGMAVTSDLVEDAQSRGHYFEVLAKPVQPKVLLAYLTGTVSGLCAGSLQSIKDAASRDEQDTVLEVAQAY